MAGKEREREKNNMEPSQDDIHRQPWKYLGYRRYAQFISSDDDLLIFRKFNDLSVRIALRLQDRISVLETRLTDIDISHSKKESNPVHNGTLRNGKDDRETIPNEIEIALSRYCTCHQAPCCIKYSNNRCRQVPHPSIRYKTTPSSTKTRHKKY